VDLSIPRETMIWRYAPGERDNGGFMSEKKLTIYEYSILRAAVQAKEKLKDPGLLHVKDGIRKNLDMLRLGQQILGRLKGEGLQLPEIDLTYPPPAAAAPANVESRKAAASDELH
jgi:hypothetical protein